MNDDSVTIREKFVHNPKQNSDSESSPIQTPATAKVNIKEATTISDHSFKETISWQKQAEEISDADRAKMIDFLCDLTKIETNKTNKEWTQSQLLFRKKYKICPKKAQLGALYREFASIISNGSDDDIDKFIPKSFKLNPSLETFLTRKAVRSLSGVLVITIFTSPYPKFIDPKTGKEKIQKFSCKHNCYYCPNEPNMPRSYLSDEPGVRRGKRHKWDAIDQFYGRACTLRDIGHKVDKIEILILGGTWSEYPQSYQEQFIRDIFWSANTFFDDSTNTNTNIKENDKSDNNNENENETENDSGNNKFSFYGKRKPLSLPEEQKLNETSKCRIIGLTLETRPDTITLDEILRFRYYGATRLQLGIQHTYDSVLKEINRGCYTSDAIKALRLLKNTGFKMDFHIMPDLPGSTCDIDIKMIEYILHSNEMQCDQWKLYPCQTVPWTVIEKWYENGTYTPYTHDDLINLMIDIKKRVHPWIRLNRVIRDIPEHYIEAGNPVTNLRQILQRRMKQQNLKCRCIRCREIGAQFRTDTEKTVLNNNNNDDNTENSGGYMWDKNGNLIKKKKKNKKKKKKEKEKNENDNSKKSDNNKDDVILKERKYNSSFGKEVFISFETNDEVTIFGFVRLRMSMNWDVFDLIDKYNNENNNTSIDVSSYNELNSIEFSNKISKKIDSKLSYYWENNEITNEIKLDFDKKNENELNNVMDRKYNKEEMNSVESIKNEFTELKEKFPELYNAALIRELHVYGQMIPVWQQESDTSNDSKSDDNSNSKNEDLISKAQHVGYGRRLMYRAEQIAYENGFRKIAVIAGIGTREYYRKIGYRLEGSYMVKNLDFWNVKWNINENYLKYQKNNKNGLMISSNVWSAKFCAAIIVVIAIFAMWLLNYLTFD